MAINSTLEFYFTLNWSLPENSQALLVLSLYDFGSCGFLSVVTWVHLVSQELISQLGRHVTAQLKPSVTPMILCFFPNSCNLHAWFLVVWCLMF